MPTSEKQFKKEAKKEDINHPASNLNDFTILEKNIAQLTTSFQLNQVETCEKKNPILPTSNLSDFIALVLDVAKLKVTFKRSQKETHEKLEEMMKQQIEILDKLNMLLAVVQQGPTASRFVDSNILPPSYKKNVKVTTLRAPIYIMSQEHLSGFYQQLKLLG